MRSACVICLLCLASLVQAQSTPVPLIDQPLVPSSAVPGGPGFSLTLNGAGFVSGSVVNWNGHLRATQFVSKTRLTATISASDIAKVGTASITVNNPGAANPTSNVVFFSILIVPSTVAFTGTNFPTSGNTEFLAVGDFNGDGKLDLAVADWTTANSVAILLGNGDGTFQPAVRYQAGAGVPFIAVGDFNGDGKLDLAATNNYDNTISILLGNGDGTFRAHVDYPVGSSPYGIAAGDFNGDGKIDLVVASQAELSILLGNGDGTFQTSTTISKGFTDWLCTGDFNGDGILDIAIADATITNDVGIILGNGNGTFQPIVAYPAGEGLSLSIATTDLNGNGVLDLVIGQWGGVTVLLGNGNGSFGPPATYTVASGSYVTAAVVDLNGDGIPDVAASSTSGGTIAVLLGHGDGTFQQPFYLQGGEGAQAMTFGDFNSDGAMDLALAVYGRGTSNGDAFVSLQTAGPAVRFSQSALGFPRLLVGTRSSPQSVSITNVGGATLDITRIGIDGFGANEFQESNKCSSTLAVGASCAITVAFAPNDRGPRKVSLSVADNSINHTQSIPVTGVGTWVTLTPSSLDFQPQKVGTKSPPRQVQLTNVGGSAISISQIKFGGAGQANFSQTNTCGNGIGGGASCTISVTFDPLFPGPGGGIMLIYDNGGGSPQYIPMRGMGTK